MRPKLVIELLAASGCTLGGMHFWRGDTPPLAATRSLATPAGGEGEEGITLVHSPRDGSRRERAGANSPPALAASTEDEPSRQSWLAPGGAPERAAPRPRRLTLHAPAAAIAAIPPLAGAGAAAPPIPELLARAALRLVGVDQAAERTWIAAIDQATLAPDARSNLIEDLNEDGFPDLTTSPRPICRSSSRAFASSSASRPARWTDVNAAAFEEAYKDLIDMLVQLGTARG
ncbi:MAG: hypothetical protein U1E76_25285 [Planctomycetota bacterium]